MCKHDFLHQNTLLNQFSRLFFFLFFLTTLSFNYQASLLVLLSFVFLFTHSCLLVFSFLIGESTLFLVSLSVILHESSWKMTKHWETHFKNWICDLALKLMIAKVLSKRIFCIIEPFDNLLQHVQLTMLIFAIAFHGRSRFSHL